MFCRIALMLAIMSTPVVLFSPSLMAQTKSDGERLLEEARQFQKAGSAGDLKKAAQKYEEALTVFRKIRDDKDEELALSNSGLVYASLGQFGKALEYYEMALALSQRRGNVKGELMNLNRIGHIYRLWGQYQKALEHYEKALTLSRQLGDVRGEAVALGSLGRVYSFWGKYQKALDCHERALAIAREIKDLSYERNAMQDIGNTYLAWGQYQNALKYYEKVLAVSRKLGHAPRVETALHSIGMVYRQQGQYQKALAYYEEALVISRKLGAVTRERGILDNIGHLCMSWGQYQKALEYYEKALNMAKKLGHVSAEGVEFANIGEAYSAWGRYADAAKYYEKALEITEQTANIKGQAKILKLMGTMYVQQGQYEKALSSFQAALTKCEETGVLARSVNDCMGNLYLDMGDTAKAEPLLKAAKRWGSLGRLQLVKSDYHGAAKYYERLRQSAEKNRSVNGLFTAYTGLGTTFERMGDDKKAEEYFLKAVNLTEDLRSSLPKDQRETFFDVRINGFLRTAPYDGLARVRVKMNRPLDAFKDSESTKSRIFAETMSKWSESTSFDIPAPALKLDSELNDQLAAVKKARQEGYEKSNQEIISAIEPQVKEMEKKFQAHLKLLRDKYPLFAATKYPEPMGLNQASLKDGEWVLAYHVTDPGIIIYLTKGKEIVKALFKPIPRDKLDSLVLTFRKPLEMVPGKDNFEEKLKSFDLIAGKKLSDLLLSDVLGSLPQHVPLLIVPDDSLGALPFEMLVLNDKGTVKTDKDLPYVSGAEFFGDRNLISYSQSVTALTLSRIHAKSKAKGAGLLAIADPVFHEKDERTAKAPKQKAPTGVMASLFRRLNLMAAENDPQMGGLKFSRLSLTGELAKTLAELGKKNAKVYTGFDASKENFMKKISPSLRRYDEVVFATHGYFGKDLPGIMEPVLVLTLVPPGTDGYLRMTEVMGLNMNADIVALTACQTGLGKRTAGEGTMGMGRAFQYAGAKSVLMSLWSVSELASVNLVKGFFRNLKKGKSKSEALSSARNDIRKKGFDHPFFWAAFILVGETN